MCCLLMILLIINDFYSHFIDQPIFLAQPNSNGTRSIISWKKQLIIINSSVTYYTWNALLIFPVEEPMVLSRDNTPFYFLYVFSTPHAMSPNQYVTYLRSPPTAVSWSLPSLWNLGTDDPEMEFVITNTCRANHGRSILWAIGLEEKDKIS